MEIVVVDVDERSVTDIDSGRGRRDVANISRRVRRRTPPAQVIGSIGRSGAVAVVVATLLLTPAAASAEAPRPRALSSAIAAFAASPPPPQTSRSSDSLKNGAIIGAVAGAAALGGFGLFLCHALDDSDGDLNCFPSVLAIAAVGAGIGAGAGVGIDALMVRRAGPAVRVRVRF